jgi:prephenate dehydrogenase
VTDEATPRLGTLLVAGVGLIGGSFALALRQAGCVAAIVGVGRTQANLDAAQARGAIDRGFLLDDRWAREAADADLVMLAAPVSQYPALLAAVASHLGPRTLVTDAGSTKQDVMQAARAALGGAFVRFVGGHPIAGSERSGAAAADAGLFRGRQVILTPAPETLASALAKVRALWCALGANVCTLDAGRHDRLLASVSHLPHLLAFALMDELARRPDAQELLDHAGGGLRDFTRIAASSPEMWRDIALANHEALCEELDRYRASLEHIATALRTGDYATLESTFARAARARRDWAAGASFPASGEDG